MTSAALTDVLYYPFHLCHERTLAQLLAQFRRVHFRDYMALQLGRFAGTTAYADRMGGLFPDLVASGRVVQGHHVSGPLSPDLRSAIDADLRDEIWRDIFHHALSQDRRFQQGLFDLSHAMMIGGRQIPGPAVLLTLVEDGRRRHPYDTAAVIRLSEQRLIGDAVYEYEYGLALLKTSAALAYTIRLASTHTLDAATDSPSHYALLNRTVTRDGLTLANHAIDRTGY